MPLSVTGSVKYRRLDSEKAHYALKISYIVNDRTVTSYDHLGEYLTENEGKLDFTFQPILVEGSTHKGPLPVFVELVTFATSERRSDPAIASNTMGQIVTVKAP